MATNTALPLVAFALVLGAVTGALVLPAAFRSTDNHTLTGSTTSAWSEVPWPFPADQFGRGKAYRCGAADCGTPVTLYVRAKIGFCNCTTGVADDEELDRIGDVDLVGRESTALSPGRPIEVHWMKGRSRAYALGGRGAWAKSALSIAFNDRCDVIVATAVIGGAEPAAREAAVLAFLNGDLILRWAETTLGL
jgi:hypothetical protein